MVKQLLGTGRTKRDLRSRSVAFHRAGYQLELLERRILLSPMVGQLFITEEGGNAIDEYTTTGIKIKSPLVSGISEPICVAVSGSDLYAVSAGVGEYSTDGGVVNPSVVSENNNVQCVAVAGSDLFVGSNLGTISEYTTAGKLVNPTLASGVYPFGIAVFGSDIFEANDAANGSVGEYTTWGKTLNASLVTGIQYPVAIAVSGSDIYVATEGGTVGKYTTSGQVLNASLISGLYNPGGIAVFGSDLFVTNVNGTRTVAEYTTSGQIVNSSFITGLNYPDGICVEAPASLGPAAQLAFGEQPQYATANSPISPGIAVAVEDKNGNIEINNDSEIALSIASGPSGASLPGGSVTATAINGIATFNDMILAKAGTYVLMASDGSLPSTRSQSLKVVVSNLDLFVAQDALYSNAATIGEYTNSGQTIKASLASGDSFQGICISSSDLFVTNWSAGTIEEYSTGGALLNASLVTGLNSPLGIAISGSDLFVANNAGSIGEYTTSGATVNATLIAGLAFPCGIATSGSDLFVTSDSSTGSIGEYTTSGKTVNASLVSGMSFPEGIAVSGSDLFVSETESFRISEFSTSGKTINNSLISGLLQPVGIAIHGSDLFVTNSGYDPGDASIGEYTTGGATINASLISNLTGAQAICVAPLDDAKRLAFTQVPTLVTAGDAFKPYVVVSIVNSAGSVVTNDSTTVTLSLAINSEDATLSGQLTVAAINGVATFTNLSIARAGSYRLVAEDGNLTAATSASFIVVSPAATESVFYLSR